MASSGVSGPDTVVSTQQEDTMAAEAQDDEDTSARFTLADANRNKLNALEDRIDELEEENDELRTLVEEARLDTATSEGDQ